jgi:hypothetical protein
LFCSPKNMAMTQPQIKSILDGYIAHHKVEMDWPIDLLLLRALKDVFPCSREK